MTLDDAKQLCLWIAAHTIHAFLWIIGIAIALQILLNAVGYGTDETDASGWNRSNFRLHTDYGTGCQYLSTPQGGVTPRYNPDGSQVCK